MSERASLWLLILLSPRTQQSRWDPRAVPPSTSVLAPLLSVGIRIELIGNSLIVPAGGFKFIY